MPNSFKVIFIYVGINLVLLALYLTIFNGTIMEKQWIGLPLLLIINGSVTPWVLKRFEPFLIKVFKIDLKKDEEPPSPPDQP